ncbi:hypothetical protein Ddye_020200 [Dipteronia dyeriana]|uniref:Transposase MuDR plant domain-containing protein n=1 Tax=Dipteronia dyeriana TaxID=168575 RepID=A0AAD9TZA7_9ROSI|nr:hypothetical protein Ddye_020200 [Dipteronia dyeriana]
MKADQLNYEGDSEKDDDKDYEAGSEGKDAQFNEVPIIDEEDDEEHVEVDEELEPDQVMIAKLVKGQPFKRMVDSVIRFNIGLIFNSKEHMREIFKDYAIQEGIEFTIMKKDKVRQTYKCAINGCGWRAHASCMIDGVTFMLKTLSDQHDYHRVYNNKKTKVKWIASKFKKLVKSNPGIKVKVIGDLLRESFKVSVDIRRLYRVNNRALKELAKDHAQCFGYLRRTFIGVDGCHLKGPFGGVLLSTVFLDANSGIFSLAVCICEKETQDN